MKILLAVIDHKAQIMMSSAALEYGRAINLRLLMALESPQSSLQAQKQQQQQI
jgi:hypothetical protein